MSSEFAFRNSFPSRSGRCGTEGLSAVGAGANATEVVVAEDARGVAVGKGDLDGVVAHCSGGLRARFGLKHGQSGGSSGTRTGPGALSYALVITCGARTFIAKVGEIVVTRVTVGPGNVDTGAAGYMDFYRGWLLAGINRNGHRISRSRSNLGFAIAAIAGRDWIAMRARFRMAKETADALVQFRADDVLELARLVVDFGIIDGERVLEKAFGQPMTAHNIAGATAAAGGQLYCAILQLD